MVDLPCLPWLIYTHNQNKHFVAIFEIKLTVYCNYSLVWTQSLKVHSGLGQVDLNAVYELRQMKHSFSLTPYLPLPLPSSSTSSNPFVQFIWSTEYRTPTITTSANNTHFHPPPPMLPQWLLLGKHLIHPKLTAGASRTKICHKKSIHQLHHRS